MSPVSMRAPLPATPGANANVAAKPEEIVQLCAFQVGAEEYVLDIMRISEIIQPLRITSVPHAPEHVEGVVNLRGSIIPVVDLRKRLSVPVAAQTKKTKYVICWVGGRRVGLVVDAVTEVLRIPRSSIKRTPAMLAQHGTRFFLGVCGPSDRLKLLLNVKALLESRQKVPSLAARTLARSSG